MVRRSTTVGLLLLAAVGVSMTHNSSAHLAPESVVGRLLNTTISKGTGDLAQYQGREFYTRFSADGTYVDMEPSGAVVDSGTYTYRIINSNVAEVNYSTSAESPSQFLGKFSEQLTFKTPESGIMHGTAEGVTDRYEGTFSFAKELPTSRHKINAPKALEGLSILTTIDRTTGWCSDLLGRLYLLKFKANGIYEDVEMPAGAIADRGTYEYKHLTRTDLQVVSHVLSSGTWQGTDYVNVFHFETATTGSYHGWETAGSCYYEGKFSIQPNSEGDH